MNNLFRKENRKKLLIWAAAMIVILLVFCWWQNNDLTVSRTVVSGDEVPAEFDGFTIVQISDLHNKSFGKQQEWLLATVEAEQPDLIVITGDMIDSRNTEVEAALTFAEGAVQIAPCYYVTGNHESRVPAEYEALKAGLTAAGVTVLENRKVTLEQDGGAITLLGVHDPAFGTSYLFGDDVSVMNGQLSELMDEEDGYTVLLSHRPELFDVYVEHDANLVFTGHAHGGQWRLPGLGGLVAPGQGFFPKYTSGAHTASAAGTDVEDAAGSGQTTMLVSRGLGNSLIPVRIFNRPEIVVVELRAE